MKRRSILKSLGLVSLPLSWAGNLLASPSTEEQSPSKGRDLFKELGVRTFINAAGTYTMMTGSLMEDEVVEAIRTTSTEFCMLDELQDKVGAKIATLVHSESAVVTAGCFSAMTLGLAGVLTGMDGKKVERLPHLEGSGMKSEVIVQKGHSIGYSQALTNTGCKIIIIETLEELEKAINEKTAMLWFLNVQSDQGKISHEKWVEIGKKYKIPTMIDIAADVPPVSNLWKFNDMGFDLVCVSGGKAMRGPQSAGILMGKRDLIAAARLSMPPRGSTIGRGMKVNKEEIVGMYVAVEKFVNKDHQKQYKIWEDRIAVIENGVKNIPGITTKVTVPPLGNVTPTLSITWDKAKIAMTTKDVMDRLRGGTPSIEVMGNGETGINITAWVMKNGEDKIVSGRLKEILSKG
jgi:D-glucosaminate-6-phosphate ammonia-lyase